MNTIIAIALATALHAHTQAPVTLPTMTIEASPPAGSLVRCSAPRELTQGSGTVRTCEVAR